MPTLTFRRVLFALSVGSALNRRAGASDTLGNASPVVVSTWPFLDAVRDAFSVLERPASTYYTTSAIDSVVAGASSCEVAQCDGSVGFGKHPDESGFVALDGMVVDGRDVSVGSVVSVKSTKHAAQLAREVLERTSHSILCGADLFASQMGFQEESLRTPESDADWMKWRRSGCQPNFWKDGRVAPDPSKTCGPYRKTSAAEDEEEHEKESNEKNSISNEAPIQFAAAQLGSETNVRPVTAPNSPRSHDTISILAIDDKRHLAAATSTNAAAYRIPGRVGDAAIPGSGGYADDRVGTCGATGDGDILVRFLPCKHALLLLESLPTPPSTEPSDVSEHLVSILRKVMKHMTSRLKHGESKSLHAGIVLMDIHGNVGGVSWGVEPWQFSYTVMRKGWEAPKVLQAETVGP